MTMKAGAALVNPEIYGVHAPERQVFHGDGQAQLQLTTGRRNYN
jgi:hypothetical protein